MTGLTDPTLSSVLFRAANHALTQNRVDGALSIADRAAAVCPGPETLICLAAFRMTGGQLGLARDALDEAARFGASEEQILTFRASLDARAGNVSAAIDTLQLILRRNPAAGVSVKYALASLLASARRFDEANASFGRGLLVVCGDGNLTCTRVVRFPEQPLLDPASIPLRRQVDYPRTVADARDAEMVYFVSADSRYFELFAQAVCNSLAANAHISIAVHIHVINPKPTIEASIGRLRRNCNLPILVSYESTQLDHLDARARRVYWSCARYLVLPELLRLYNKVILVADIDQLVVHSLRPLFDEFRGHDVGLLKFPVQITNILALISATAVIVDATRGGIQFCRTLCDNLAERLTDPAAWSWHLDQAALAVAYYLDEDLRTYLIRPSLLDSSNGRVEPPRDDAVFWSVTMTLPANIGKLSSTYFQRFLIADSQAGGVGPRGEYIAMRDR